MKKYRVVVDEMEISPNTAGHFCYEPTNAQILECIQREELNGRVIIETNDLQEAKKVFAKIHVDELELHKTAVPLFTVKYAEISEYECESEDDSIIDMAYLGAVDFKYSQFKE